MFRLGVGVETLTLGVILHPLDPLFQVLEALPLVDVVDEDGAVGRAEEVLAEVDVLLLPRRVPEVGSLVKSGKQEGVIKSMTTRPTSCIPQKGWRNRLDAYLAQHQSFVRHWRVCQTRVAVTPGQGESSPFDHEWVDDILLSAFVLQSGFENQLV